MNSGSHIENILQNILSLCGIECVELLLQQMKKKKPVAFSSGNERGLFIIELKILILHLLQSISPSSMRAAPLGHDDVATGVFNCRLASHSVTFVMQLAITGIYVKSFIINVPPFIMFNVCMLCCGHDIGNSSRKSTGFCHIVIAGYIILNTNAGLEFSNTFKSTLKV